MPNKLIYASYDLACTRCLKYYNTILNKIKQVKNKSFELSDLEVVKSGNFYFAKHSLFSDVIVRQAECDGLMLFSKINKFDQKTSFFSSYNSQSPLFNHFKKIENEFFRTNQNQFRQTPKYVFPGESKVIFKCVPKIGPSYEPTQTSEGWRMHQTGYVVKGHYLQLLGGNTSIQKMIEFDPIFLTSWAKHIRETEDIEIQRFDLNSDFNLDIVPEVLKNIKLGHYNSFGKSVYAVPDIEKIKKSNKNFKAAKEESNETKNLKAIRLSKEKNWESQLPNDLEQKTNTLYAGNYKKSTLTVVMYNKRSQASSKKKSFSALKSRMEIRLYPKNREIDTEFDYRGSNQISPTKTKTKPLQKLAQNEVSYPKIIYTKILENYTSDLSIGLRCIIYLNSLINGFTLNPNSIDKKLLTPWYVDNLVIPMILLIQKFAIKNPEFQKISIDPKELAKKGPLIEAFSHNLIISLKEIAEQVSETDKDRFLDTQYIKKVIRKLANDGTIFSTNIGFDIKIRYEGLAFDGVYEHAINQKEENRKVYKMKARSSAIRDVKKGTEDKNIKPEVEAIRDTNFSEKSIKHEEELIRFVKNSLLEERDGQVSSSTKAERTLLKVIRDLNNGLNSSIRDVKTPNDKLSNNPNKGELKVIRDTSYATKDLKNLTGDTNVHKEKDNIYDNQSLKNVIQKLSQKQLAQLERMYKRFEKSNQAEKKAFVFSTTLNEIELKGLEYDLIQYLNSNIKSKSEKDFLEGFLAGRLNLKPSQPQNVKYETWRRGDRGYNVPWIKIKRKVYQETGLKFKRYSPELKPIESEYPPA